jgi:DNA repair photolyase
VKDVRKTGTKEWAEISKNIMQGCKHNCKYCIDGNTQILMMDGTSRMIKNLSVGDKIVGIYTLDQFNHRSRYTHTSIKDIWTIYKQAYEIKLKNGTTIICSDDHKWLTTRGWKYTYGKMGGDLQRPYLTTKSIIKGFGVLTPTPSISNKFRKGYLSGIIKGDGTLKKYDYSGKGNGKINRQYHFRLAMTDIDALTRTDEYLRHFGIKVIWNDFTSSYIKPMKAIRTNKEKDYKHINKLIHISNEPEWLRGWLSGIFDAEGSYSAHNIRISNTNPEILSTTLCAFEHLGFNAIIQKSNRSLKTIRLMGGITEYIRFFNLINTAIPRKFNIFNNAINIGTKVISIRKLKKRKLWDITTGTGNFIANGCIAHNCYARSNAIRFRIIQNKDEWTKIRLSRGKLDEPTYNLCGKRIMFPTSHDIFPEFIDETVKYLEGWLKYDNEILIVSKPHLDCIKKICDDLKKYKKQIVFRFTIGSYDNSVLKFWEAEAPNFEERFDSLKYAFSGGFVTSVSCEPFLDGNIIALVEKLLPFISDSIWIGKMNKIRERVDLKGWTQNDLNFLNLVEKSQTDEKIHEIYNKLKDNPKVKWKDSIKQIMRLPEEEIG